MKHITQSGFGLWKIVLTIALAVLFLAALTAVVNAATIYVPDDHGTIQGAVNAANPGDIIIVRDGTYTENVDVNKELTIRSEGGAASTIVQAANPHDQVFEVTADDVTLSGFTVKGASEVLNAGICLSGADYCIISDNKVSNNYLGIWLLSSGNTLTDNTASNNKYGIVLWDSSGNELAGNIANSNNYDGILLSESSGNKLTSNTANLNNECGIRLSGSSGNTLRGNTINSNNEYGIDLSSSSGNELTSNTASNNDGGISLDDSSNNNELTSNTASNNLVGIYLGFSSNNALTSNNADSNNLYGILLRHSSSNVLTSNTASNNDEGILLLSQSNGNTLTDSIASTNGIGIRLSESSDNILTSNTANSNSLAGIWLAESSGNKLTGNTASNNPQGHGIWLGESNGNTLTDNTASNNENGISLGWSSDNTLKSNTANSNNGEGIGLVESSGNTLTDNIANSNSLAGIWLFKSSDNRLTGNTLSNNDGGINLVFSNDNSLTGNTVDSNNLIGIRLESSSGNELTSNTADSNNDGIGLLCSSGNTLTSNTVSNNEYGIWLDGSSNNKIYINSFISNTNNVHPDGSNDWNSPSKITYTYKRRTYRNYLGNYWDDYTDVDANNDGIWDTPYSINSDNDIYPLVGRIRNHEIAPYYVHDMAITDVYTDPPPPLYVGQPTTIYVTVENEGDLQENNVPVTVKAYVGLSPFGRQVGSTRVTLSAGESTTESFTWTPSMAKTYYIKGEVGIVGGETDTSDNKKTISVSVREQNQRPTCAIELRKQGTTTSINEVKVGEFFDIYVGDSTDDTGIKEVRLSSDDSQDGNPTGTWTSWYDWDTSSDDWDAVSKTKAWSFATEGSKEVWAEVKDDAGQTAKCSANIYSNQPPVALFTYSPQNPVIGEEITFDASDSYDPDGEIVSYEWDFGDDSTGNGEVVTHAYSSADAYTVTLTVTDDDGVTDSTSKVVNVKGFGTEVGEYNGIIAYSNGYNDYVSYEYNYVDGYNTGMKWQCVEYVNRYYYIIYGMEIRIPGTNAKDYYGTASDRGLIAYPNGGATPPQLGDILCSNGGDLGHVAIVREVTDDSIHIIHQNWANTEVDNDKIINMWVSNGHSTVSGFSPSYPVQGWLRKENQPPIADAGTDQGVYSGDVVTFDGSKSSDPEGGELTYHWHFGDGETATGQQVTHRFRGAMSEEKEYTVELTVEDDKGATDTDTVSVTVYPLKRYIPVYSSLSHLLPPPQPKIMEVRVYYNWVDEIEGQDEYIVSEVHLDSAADLNFALYMFSIKDDGEKIWSRIHKGVGKEDVSFVYPFNVPWDCSKTIGDEHFKGLAVGPNSNLNFVVYGVELGLELRPSFFRVSRTIELGPGEQTEVPSIYPEGGMDGILATVASPVELRTYDSNENVTGLVNGEIKEEIPNSMYDEESKTCVIFSPQDINSHRYETAGTDEGAYRLGITSVKDGETTTTFTATDIPTASGAIHQYTIDWEALSQGEKGATVQMDSDGDGVFEQTVTTGDTFQLPIASFTYSPAHPVVNQTITFNASPSHDPDGTIVNYEWNFGDGNITNTTEEIITHAYASAGDYTVNLTVTDNDGATSTDTQSIFITRIQKGMSYAAWWHDTYATNDSDTSLENLKGTCTEWVSLVVTWYQDNASSTEIYRDDNRTPTDDSLIHAINKIHSLNMSVMLKPTVDLQDENWRGNINFDNIAYSDALGLGWQDWSWDCNRNFESATSVYRGKYAINVSFEPWGGLSFANPEGVNTDRYDSLEFYINGGERGGQQLRLSLTDDKGNELPSSGGISINNPKYIDDGIISAKAWKLVSVPLEDLNATNTKIIKINIMDNIGHAQPTLYIDDVMLTAPQSKWNEWFSSYEQFILHYADLAEKNNCEQFCVGVEYKGTVQREDNWRDIIEKVKEHYTGPITYASNWDNYQNINWWDASALDFVGIDAYFPLTEEADPTVDELKERWKKWGEEIESWQQRVNKSIIFTEIGYCSLDGTNIEPWNWTYSDIVDLQEQADCYNATFQTFWNKEWLAGIYWWMWDTDPDVGGPLDKSYTPYKKPAEGVVKKYYCAEKVSFLHKERLIGGPV